ncbi:hypothetical protein REPUB_Repub11eG0134800 [Reevesia pubescens]
MQSLAMNIANRNMTKFWIDSWLPCRPLINNVSREILKIEAEYVVVDYYGEDGRFKVSQLTDILSGEIILLMATKWINPYSDVKDSITWMHTHDEIFSVKRAYQLQLLNLSTGVGWSKLWSLKCPSKIKIFL